MTVMREERVRCKLALVGYLFGGYKLISIFKYIVIFNINMLIVTSRDEYRYYHSKVTYIDYLIQQRVDHRSIKIPNRQLLVDDHCMI